MMCYRDMTFCDFWRECDVGDHCASALTDRVRAGARAWWGKDDAPICKFAERPTCFRQKEG